MAGSTAALPDPLDPFRADVESPGLRSGDAPGVDRWVTCQKGPGARRPL